MNHSSKEKLGWFAEEYPDAIECIRAHGTEDGLASYDACVTEKARLLAFFNTGSNRCAPFESISTDTTGSTSQQDMDWNKYLQLLADAGTG